MQSRDTAYVIATLHTGEDDFTVCVSDAGTETNDKYVSVLLSVKNRAIGNAVISRGKVIVTL